MSKYDLVMENCSACGRIILEDEYIINFGWCDSCLDESFDLYLQEQHLIMQLKIKPPL